MSRNLCGKELEFGMVSSNHLDVRTVFHYLRDALIQDLAIPYAVDFHELCRDREDLLLDPSSLEDEDEEEIPSGESIFLGNGFRFYLDMRKIEASTPECFRVSEVITWERGMAYLLEEALYIATLKARADGFHGEIDLLKNNMDMYGNTYGCHWNILTDRKNPLLYDPTDFRDIAKVLVPFFATSSIYTGAGTCVDKEGNIHWSISARSLFMEEDSSSSTTSKRGLVNLRDEPLANREKYRRLHLISPDHNMSEFQAWLGLGIATLVVGMVERGDPGFLDYPSPERGPSFPLSLPYSRFEGLAAETAIQVSKNPCSRFKLRNGTEMTALEHQWAFYKLLRKNHAQGVYKDDPEAEPLLSALEQTLTSLQDQTFFAANRLDHLIQRNADDRWLHRKQKRLIEKNKLYKTFSICDWNVLEAWSPFARFIRGKRLEAGLRLAVNQNPDLDVTAYLNPLCHGKDKETLNGFVSHFNSQYLPAALAAYSGLIDFDVSYHSIKSRRELWTQLDPTFVPGSFHALREGERIPSAWDMLPSLAHYKTLEGEVDEMCRQTWTQAPPGRARVRGKMIAGLRQQRKCPYADWDVVAFLKPNGSEKKIYLPDPLKYRSRKTYTPADGS